MKPEHRSGSHVRPKKHFGQHFLTNEDIARQIVGAIGNQYGNIVEIGPGTGVLTKYLVEKGGNITVVEVDVESVEYLKRTFGNINIISHDFLTLDLSQLDHPFAIIGNFPYNISSQIMFRVLEYRDHIPLLVGMFQLEVAQRLIAPPGTKNYGILSVLLQVWYDGEFLFSVDANNFYPPPKVVSGVIRLRRNSRINMQCKEDLFKKVVKQAFNQRRKTLRNSLRSLVGDSSLLPWSSKRPEQLTWQQFEEITLYIEEMGKTA